MTGIIYPVKTEVQGFTPDGKAIAKTGLATLHDSEGNKYGGGPAHTAEVEPESLWTRKERTQWRIFCQAHKRYEKSIGVDKDKMEQELIFRFGTTSPGEYRAVLNLTMAADPRLTVTTRRGAVRTTVELQRQTARRAGLEGGKT